MTEKEIETIYKSKYGDKCDRVITVSKSQKGNFVVSDYYEPNSFKSVLQRKVTYNGNGEVINLEEK